MGTEQRCPPDLSSIVLAVDHAPAVLPMELQDLSGHIEIAADLGLGGVVLNYGPALRYHSQLAGAGVEPIVRVDGNETVLGGPWLDSPNWEHLVPLERCAAIGVRQVACNLLLGGPAELSSIRVVSQVIAEAHRLGLKTRVSSIALASTPSRETAYSNDPDHISYSARIAEEMGADVVVAYTRGNPRTLDLIAQRVVVPVWAANVPNAQSPALEFAQACAQSGFAGLTVGSALWTKGNWGAFARQLAEPFR